MYRVALALLLLGLSACGFQLRGAAPIDLKTLYVSTAAPSQVAIEIHRQLAGGPTRLAASAKEGEAHLRILSEVTEKNIQTLTGAGRVFDYQLRLKVGYQVTGPGGAVVIGPADIDLYRIISYSESAPLAKEAEERLLFEEMRSEAAARILRRIAVVHAGASPK